MNEHVTLPAERADLSGLLQRSAGARHAVLMIDLDGFKAINDVHGHQEGDRVLEAAAARLARDAPEGALVARFGGDEFTVVVPDIGDSRQALTVAHDLLASLAEPMTAVGQASGIRASVGVALYPDHGTDIATLLAHADEAMCRCKKEGPGARAAALGGSWPAPPARSSTSWSASRSVTSGWRRA